MGGRLVRPFIFGPLMIGTGAVGVVGTLHVGWDWGEQV